MIDQLSKQLQIKVLESLSYGEKLAVNEKEARDILILNPDYTIYYLKTKFSLQKQKSTN